MSFDAPPEALIRHRWVERPSGPSVFLNVSNFTSSGPQDPRTPGPESGPGYGTHLQPSAAAGGPRKLSPWGKCFAISLGLWVPMSSMSSETVQVLTIYRIL